MKRQPLYYLLLCLSLCLATISAADEEEVEYPEATAARLQSRYDTIKTLSFDFHQETGGELTGRSRNGSGSALFYNIGSTPKMRWDYTEPDKQILLSDGITFSMYFSELNQMIITSAEQLKTDLTYSFFSGNGKLDKEFFIRPADKQYQSSKENTYKIIKLIPRIPHAQVQDIHLWVAENSLIRRILIQDHFGTKTTLTLSEIVIDGLSDLNRQAVESLFSYTPPPGTELIRQ